LRLNFCDKQTKWVDDQRAPRSILPVETVKWRGTADTIQDGSVAKFSDASKN
jgi:hypothetical protein